MDPADHGSTGTRRIRGMLGANGPDEFPAFEGWRPPVLRSEIEEFVAEDALMVLDGDSSGHGFHRAGSRWAKSEFPPSWNPGDVVDSVRAVIDAPSDGMPGGNPSRFSLLGVFDHVVVVVRIRNDFCWRVATTHPYDLVRWRCDIERLGR